MQARKRAVTQADFETQIAMMDTEQIELERAYREAIQDIPDESEAQRLEELAQTFFVKCQEKLEWLDNPPGKDEQRAWEARRELVKILFDEIIIDPEGQTMRLIGGFDRMVHFQIEQSRPSSSLNGNG
jgi:hypothetical protein